MDSRSSPCSEGSDEYLSADDDCSTEDGVSRARQRMEKLRVGKNESGTISDCVEESRHVSGPMSGVRETTAIPDLSQQMERSEGQGSTSPADATAYCGAVGGDSKDEQDFVKGLDNRVVSEDVEVKGGKVELTEEQIKEMKEHSIKLKNSGNEAFRNGEYQEALGLYTEAIEVYPSPDDEDFQLAICFANRAACYSKQGLHESVIDDCTRALELKPDYLKALVRRAQSSEALEKLDNAFEDYKKVLELDPSQPNAREAVMRLPEQIKEQHEKLKTEMLGKLKELGNVVLKPFGLSTNNFEFKQDPNTGGYSVNFKK